MHLVRHTRRHFSGHATKMAVTPFDPPNPKAPCKHHGSMFDRTGVSAENGTVVRELVQADGTKIIIYHAALLVVNNFRRT